MENQRKRMLLMMELNAMFNSLDKDTEGKVIGSGEGHVVYFPPTHASFAGGFSGLGPQTCREKAGPAESVQRHPAEVRSMAL